MEASLKPKPKLVKYVFEMLKCSSVIAKWCRVRNFGSEWEIKSGGRDKCRISICIVLLLSETTRHGRQFDHL